MKDPLFSGEDVAAAKAAAAQALGVPQAALRFVVLDPGAPAGPGLSGRPARIAVLMSPGDAPLAAAPAPAPADWRATLEQLLGAFAKSAGVELGVEIGETEDQVTARLSGPREYLLEDDAALVRALEHLLQRALADSLDKRLVVDCDGYRRDREDALRAKARAWAAEVLSSGQAKQTPPLNAYERRVVHMAVAEEPRLRTFSVGEGGDRRVTIAPKDSSEA